MFYDDESFNTISDPVDYMTYDEIYEEALKKASQMYFKALNLEDPREMLAVGEAFHHEATPLLLHFIMFLVRQSRGPPFSARIEGISSCWHDEMRRRASHVSE